MLIQTVDQCILFRVSSLQKGWNSLTCPWLFQKTIKILMCVQHCHGESGGMLPWKTLKIRMLRLAENEFHTKKFLTFLWLFPLSSKFPDISRFSRSLDTQSFVHISTTALLCGCFRVRLRTIKLKNCISKQFRLKKVTSQQRMEIFVVSIDESIAIHKWNLQFLMTEIHRLKG